MASTTAETTENALAVVFAMVLATGLLIGAIQYPLKSKPTDAMVKHREITLDQVKKKIDALSSQGVADADR